jgi:taurine--2-oxoglutarate transaminase
MTDVTTEPTAPATFRVPTDQATVRANDRAHVFHSWSAQGAINPLPIARASGSRFWDYDGTEYLDFSSGLVHANIGYGHPKLVAAVQEQAGRMATIAPGYAVDVRSEAARLIASKAPEGLEMVFFTNGGAEATENAIRMARLHTGRHKVLAAYRSYHGATAGALTMTGDPRRIPSEPGLPGIVHFWGPYPYRSAFHSTSPEQETERALTHLRDTIMVEGPGAVAAIILETVVGTNGVLVPPPGYLAGVRAICDELGIMMIADEVMAGFARCGEWFAIQHWGVTPDLITFAKGVNSGYVPIAASSSRTPSRQRSATGCIRAGSPIRGTRWPVPPRSPRSRSSRRRESSSTPGCSAPTSSALSWSGSRRTTPASARFVAWARCGRLSSSGDRETREPLVPYNASGAAAAPMTEFAAACKERGLWPFVHFNRTHVVPPCTTSVEEVREGLAILDEALTVADRHTTSG